MAKKTKKKAAKKVATKGSKTKKKSSAVKKVKKSNASAAAPKKAQKKATKKPKGLVQKIGEALGLAAEESVTNAKKKTKVKAVRGKKIQSSTQETLAEATQATLDKVKMQYTLPNYDSIDGREVCNAQGESACGELTCEKLTRSGGFCRLHYIRNWRKIKRKELILKEGKLNRYIEELVNKYPDRYMDAIRTDLENDNEFAKTIQELEIDDSSDFDDESSDGVESIIGGIRRDMDEDDFD